MKKNTTTELLNSFLEHLNKARTPVKREAALRTSPKTPFQRIEEEGKNLYESAKNKILKAIEKAKTDINEEDLPYFTKKFHNFITADKNSSYYKDINISEKNDVRVVVIGDLHCDINSLCGLLKKISHSDYNYFEKAYFVFLGDYLDRGEVLFEMINLLIELKKILKERCVFLKGNHELIYYSAGRLHSDVSPHQTVDTFNKYCSSYKRFLKDVALFFSTLPYYVLLKTKSRTFFLVHGGIPDDMNIDFFKIDNKSGEIILDNYAVDIIKKLTKEDGLVNSKNKAKSQNLNILLDSILNSLLWGDPREVNQTTQQNETRFEFGKIQFEKFIKKNKIDILIRGHKAEIFGTRSFYDDRLFTVFSTGGALNTVSGYDNNVYDPAFAVVSDSGDIIFENIFSQVILSDKNKILLNTLNNELINDKNSKYLHLNEEFYLDIHKNK